MGWTWFSTVSLLSFLSVISSLFSVTAPHPPRPSASRDGTSCVEAQCSVYVSGHRLAGIRAGATVKQIVNKVQYEQRRGDLVPHRSGAKGNKSEKVVFVLDSEDQLGENSTDPAGLVRLT